VFDNAKVSDHFAIIPTLLTPKHLSEVEAKLYDLVVKRFLSIFFPAAEYLVTTRITEVEGHSFKTEGKVLVEPGWLAIYGREAMQEQGSLPKIDQGERVRATDVQSVALATRPPARYTEATLLSAMEGAGKLIEDDDLRAAMAGKGLGTPATRSQIIEGLIDQRYMVRDGKDLRPTRKAFDLITLLKGLDIEELTAPELTGEWEHKLSLMEHGQLKRDRFMKEIAGMTKKVVDRAKSYQSNTVPIDDPATLVTPCPNCKGKIVENYRRYACTKCEFSLSKHPGSRTFEVEEVEQLLRDRTIGPLNGFISKMGRPFAAVLKITPELKLEFDFGQTNDDGSTDPIDFSKSTPIGPCPKCGGRVFEQPMSYLCENSVGAGKRCDFRSGKVILQQPIDATQMAKLLNEGRTDVMRGFVSNRTRRKFSAFLVRKPDGTTGFEFEPRPVKIGAPAKRAGKTTNGTVEAAPVTKPSKTRVRAAVVAGATAVSRVKSKQARKVSGAAARKPVANTARTSSARKPAARR
jgi:DNA topoisomerase-3